MEADSVFEGHRKERQRIDALLSHYVTAKSWMERSNFSAELEWQRTRNLLQVDEAEFLREYAWVILNSGFRESVVRKHFDYISLCFCDWESAAAIVDNSDRCLATAGAVFRNSRKLQAILAGAMYINGLGYDRFWKIVQRDPVERLKVLPFIADITSCHLAKNLGFDVAKPDRHLVRVARRFGYDDVSAMCEHIKIGAGDPISVADLVLWRFEEQFINSRRTTT